ncbi:diguanylate cyclase [candidate division WOR-3 bacterium]|nr:diguanylate cyclase [candidate division WOR-3 bacterium]
MTILIVDDSEDQLLVLKAILNEKGYKNILLADSADKAFELIGLRDKKRKKDIDLILMDIMMPDVDGLEACLKIKKNEELKDIPIIMVTAKKEADHLQSAFQAGAVDYITKPINVTELLARVHSALRLKMEIDSRKERERELTEMAEQLDAANKKLTRMSYLDGLTDVPNRRYFEEVFAREWKNAIRENGFLSIIMFDIDCFKAYNDTYGHLIGDDCLKKIAKTLSSALKRPRDFLCRYGGEEFIAVLPDTDGKGAFEVANRFLKKTKNLKITHKTSPVSKNVTISIGVATIKPDRKKKSNFLITEVDKALYEAKQSGRNCIKIVCGS